MLGWSKTNKMPQDIMLSAVDMAASRCEMRIEAISHSDRGRQFAAQAVRDAQLTDNEIVEIIG